MSGYQVQAYSDDEAIVTPLSEEGEPTGGGWIGCCDFPAVVRVRYLMLLLPRLRVPVRLMVMAFFRAFFIKKR